MGKKTALGNTPTEAMLEGEAVSTRLVSAALLLDRTGRGATHG